MRAFPPELERDDLGGLVRLATRLAGQPEAEDLVQSTLVRALERGEGVRSARSWLAKVMVNERRMQVRARIRRGHRERFAGPPEEDPVQLDDVVHCLELAAIVGELVDDLDEKTASAVRQRFFDGKTPTEIAREHSIPPGTVRWRIKTGLDTLRGRLDERYGGRRALWAAAFADLPNAPTPGGSAASVAPKGAMAMSAKMILGLGVLGAAVAGSVWIGSRGESEAEAVERRVDPPHDKAASENPAVVPAVPERPAARRWEQRVRRIRQAGAHLPKATNTDAVEIGDCVGYECVQKLLEDEIKEALIDCRDLIPMGADSVTLAADMIGAPDVGTLVVDVTPASGVDVPPALLECVTQSLYALDIGAPNRQIERSFKMRLGMIQLSAKQMTALLNKPDLPAELRTMLEADLRDPAAAQPVFRFTVDPMEDDG